MTTHTTTNRKNQKNHNGGGGSHRPKPKHYGPRKTIEILPSPETLEAYDCVLEGSAQIIMDMFEEEQMHRHRWEEQALKVHMVSTVLGQVLGFLIAIAIFVSASVIGIYGDQTVGASIWVFGMAIVVMAGLVWAYAKTMGQRPLFSRPAMRTHFRPEKEKNAGQE